MSSTVKSWIEATRLRTLPVSIAGVITGIGCGIAVGEFNLIPSCISLLFAVLAQIASNFANEYFDYRNGFDRKGREGFRRGVTEGDITPKAMLRATLITLSLACLIGLTLIFYGGWWLIPIGILIALFALGYSAGPYPLSHHGLGDIAVIIFFGIVPVVLTAYVQHGNWTALPLSLPLGISTGLLAALVLVVNNYRDYEDDKRVGKYTTVVIFGRKFMAHAYLAAAWTGVGIALITLSDKAPMMLTSMGIIFLFGYWLIYRQLIIRHGAELNPMLGLTAGQLLLFSIYLLFSLTAIYAQ
ncbi:MAG: 1,4-dihydroxy-2-naphthoate octaprenyltransferase [Prevotella sp.]|nr:1,4-dihydroxy-2-naphthoate octaprenyltransferase [Bacteroides sp.]MCM1366703.1 1,4-dihydroxy-2-naphthoate octaprenyltransferase [Prevotella sp.]MCM1437283.1 1,4-dihydroxy-2-naphthoate octaprenyltransferase [Prevotella sp.]